MLTQQQSFDSHSSRESSWVPIEAPNHEYVQGLFVKLLKEDSGSAQEQLRRMNRIYHQVGIFKV